MISHLEQPVGKPDDDEIDPIFELLAIKKETDDIQKHLENIDKCISRLAVLVANDDENKQ